jgi:hypothetical protein
MDEKPRERLRHEYLANAPSGLLSRVGGMGLSTQAVGLGWDRAPLWGSKSISHLPVSASEISYSILPGRAGTFLPRARQEKQQSLQAEIGGPCRLQHSLQTEIGARRTRASSGERAAPKSTTLRAKMYKLHPSPRLTGRGEGGEGPPSRGFHPRLLMLLPSGEHGTVKPLRVSLVEPVACSKQSC